jgi:hypothetical protein
MMRPLVQRSLLGLMALFAFAALAAVPAAAAPSPAVALRPYVQVSPTAVLLRGYVNPNGEATVYYFEYGSSDCAQAGACASAPTTRDADAGAATEAGPVSRLVTGLAPGTSYHFRLVTENGSGASTSEDAEFVTPPPPAPSKAGGCPNEALREEQGVVGRLPECRAYELVSVIPEALRNSADVGVNTERTRAATDGNALVFASATGTDEVSSLPAQAEYMATRGTAGWTVRGILPPQEPTSFWEVVFGDQARYVDMSPDLSKGIFLSNARLNGEGANLSSAKKLYLRDDLLSPGSGSYRLLSDSSIPHEVEVDGRFREFIPVLAATSADFSHVLFESRLDLTASAAGLPEGPRLYEWVAGAGVRLAGVLPADEGGGPTLSQAGRGALNGYFTDRTLSRDGSRIVFTAASFFHSDSGPLYLREDRGTLDPGDDRTLPISASEKTNGGGPGGTDPAGPQPATFWTATPDLSQIFFTSKEALTDDAPVDEPDLPKLYRFDADASPGHRLSLISVDEEPGDGIEDAANAAIGVADDGSYVYFAGPNQLQEGGPTQPATRIFVWHDGEIREVGGINPGEELERIAGIRRAKGILSFKPSARWSRVSSDGRQLLFVSEGTDELTGYDQGSSCPADAGPSCTEVYMYDASPTGPGRLQCASCNPTGVPATADANFSWRYNEIMLAGDAYQSRALSQDGRYAFFSSGDQLVPGDGDESQDTYSFDAQTGEIHLLSGADGGEGAHVMDTSSNGADVFFTTRQQLVAADRNDARDLYDARVDGGFDEAAPEAVPCASAESCRPPQGPPAAAPVPPSESAAPRRAGRPRHRHHRRHRTRRHRRRSAHPPSGHHRPRAGRNSG